VLTCGEDLASSEVGLAIAERHRDVSVAVGVHPHRSPSLDHGGLSELRSLARHPSVVAIGEIGIDLSGRSAPREAQERAFDEQVALAAELGLPVVVHVRDSGAEVRARLDALPRVRGQVHCYSEGRAEVGEWIRRDFFVSFAGTLTFPKSDALRAACRTAPADRLLFETDAPYLAPVPLRGRRNEPAYVRETIRCAAHERGEDPDALGERAWRNALGLFGPALARKR
jgi:TatD DNase family protein